MCKQVFMHPCSFVQLYNLVTLQTVIVFFVSDIKTPIRIYSLVWQFTYM